MNLNTTRFGQLEVEESNIITFEKGLPGFDNLKKYVLLTDAQDATSFKWLQSLEHPEIALPMVDPFQVKKDYEFDLDNSTKESLQIKSQEDLTILSVAVIPNKITQMTTNLKAPIIINTTNNKATQMILNDNKYSTKHVILNEILTSVFVSNTDQVK